jgi:hypothetical protein
MKVERFRSWNDSSRYEEASLFVRGHVKRNGYVRLRRMRAQRGERDHNKYDVVR